MHTCGKATSPRHPRVSLLWNLAQKTTFHFRRSGIVTCFLFLLLLARSRSAKCRRPSVHRRWGLFLQAPCDLREIVRGLSGVCLDRVHVEMCWLLIKKWHVAHG